MKLLLVDDHALFRSGLKLLLRELPGENECFEAGNPFDALAFADKEIDLILLDLSMPGSHGTSALERMRESFDDVPIVVISSEDDPALIRQVIDLGASGFVPKSSTHRILISALQLILAGGVYLPMHVLSQSARSAPALSNSDLTAANPARPRLANLYRQPRIAGQQQFRQTHTDDSRHAGNSIAGRRRKHLLPHRRSAGELSGSGLAQRTAGSGHALHR